MIYDIAFIDPCSVFSNGTNAGTPVFLTLIDFAFENISNQVSYWNNYIPGKYTKQLIR